MYKKNQILYFVLVVLGIMSAVMFQNCSEVKPLTSQGDLAPEPEPNPSGTDDEDGDGGDLGGNNGSGNNNQQGSYDNSDPYKCDYNDDGIVDFETKTNGVVNTVRPVGMDHIQPVNLTMHVRTWESQWTGFSWPRETGQLATIGSWSALVTGAWSGRANAYNRNTPAAGMYITMPFRPTDSDARTYSMKWTEAQPLSGFYTMSRRTDEITVTVSSCAGDLRPKNRNSQDMYLKYCRTNSTASTSGGFAFAVYAQGGQQPDSICALEAGKTYWLTIAMARSSASDFLTGTRNGCADPDYDGHPDIEQCEANFSFR